MDSSLSDPSLQIEPPGSTAGESLRRSPITDEDRDNFLRPETQVKLFFNRVTNGGVREELVADDKKIGVVENDPENQEVEEEGDGNAGVVHICDDAANNRHVEDGDDARTEKIEDDEVMEYDFKNQEVEEEGDGNAGVVDFGDDAANIRNVEDGDEARTEEIEDDGVRGDDSKNQEVGEGDGNAGVFDVGDDDARTAEIEDDGIMEDDSENQEVEEGDGNSSVVDVADDATDIRNVEDGDHARSEEIEDDDAIDEDFKVGTDEREGEKVEDDDHTNPKELVENDDKIDKNVEYGDGGTRGKEAEDEDMKNEEIKGGADTKGKEVELDYDLNLERDDKIGKEIEGGDYTSSKEDTIDQKIEKSCEEIKNPDDLEENVAEDHDDDTKNNKKMDQDGVDIHRMSEPVRFSDDESLPMVTADPMSPAPPADLDIVSIDTFPEQIRVASAESLSEFSVIGTIKASPTPRHGPIDLVAVLDVSGSMHGLKLELLKSAIVFFIGNLNPSYRLSIVSFSTHAQRILPLCKMTEHGRENAKRCVNLLSASGSTNIVEALEKGVRVLEERICPDAVSGIMLFSDGRDTCYHCAVHVPRPGQRQQYLHLLPASIYPGNLGMEDRGQQLTFPVYTFCLGADHDPLSMVAISLASSGEFYFIESHEKVEGALLSCTGALLGVVAQELELIVRSASHGAQIKSICSRYASEISDDGSLALIHVGNVWVEKQENFLVNVSVPVFRSVEGNENGSRTTHLLDIGFSYIEVMSNEMAQIDADKVLIMRPESPSVFGRTVSLTFDETRNLLSGVQAMRQAQQMAKKGDFAGARFLLSNTRSNLLASASWRAWQAGQARHMCLLKVVETKLKRMEEIMERGSLCEFNMLPYYE